MEFLTNPWVIIAIVLAVVISNIMAVKYTANAKFGMKKKKPEDAFAKKETTPATNKKKSGYDDDDDEPSGFI